MKALCCVMEKISANDLIQFYWRWQDVGQLDCPQQMAKLLLVSIITPLDGNHDDAYNRGIFISTVLQKPISGSVALKQTGGHKQYFGDMILKI